MFYMNIHVWLWFIVVVNALCVDDCYRVQHQHILLLEWVPHQYNGNMYHPATLKVCMCGFHKRTGLACCDVMAHVYCVCISRPENLSHDDTYYNPSVGKPTHNSEWQVTCLKGWNNK